MKKIELLFLGTGGSMGVPVVGCHCAVCRSQDQHNTRFRTSALIKVGGKTFLIDAGPDFRMQMLTYAITGVDGVLLTHAHNDHIAGVDELRAFYIQNRQPLPCLMSKATYGEIKERFSYIFAPKQPPMSFVTSLNVEIFPTDRGDINFLGVPIRYFSYEQGGMAVNGFRFGDFVYMSDIHTYPSSIFEDLKGVKTLVISAVDYKSTPVHFSIDEACAFSKKVEAKETWLVHISHKIDHVKASQQLPESVRIAYDGLEIVCE